MTTLLSISNNNYFSYSNHIVYNSFLQGNRSESTVVDVASAQADAQSLFKAGKYNHIIYGRNINVHFNH